MNLGVFSISLAVKDIAASKAFYEKLGFTKFGGDQSQNWLILKNGEHVSSRPRVLHSPQRPTRTHRGRPAS
jgi:catechol 2,3-dioxygenase-like lactoylglutathione lyase family enzyme